MIERMEYEERYGEEVGRCNTHKIQIVDRSCDLCELEDENHNNTWRCNECLEIRVDDARIEAGMKCGVCAYD